MQVAWPTVPLSRSSHAATVLPPGSSSSHASSHASSHPRSAPERGYITHLTSFVSAILWQ